MKNSAKHLVFLLLVLFSLVSWRSAVAVSGGLNIIELIYLADSKDYKEFKKQATPRFQLNARTKLADGLMHYSYRREALTFRAIDETTFQYLSYWEQKSAAPVIVYEFLYMSEAYLDDLATSAVANGFAEKPGKVDKNGNAIRSFASKTHFLETSVSLKNGVKVNTVFIQRK